MHLALLDESAVGVAIGVAVDAVGLAIHHTVAIGIAIDLLRGGLLFLLILILGSVIVELILGNEAVCDAADAEEPEEVQGLKT